jgi:hypothetical protein
MDDTGWQRELREGQQRKRDLKERDMALKERSGIVLERYHDALAGQAMGANESSEKIAGMHYGPGGAIDRTNTFNAPFRDAQTGYYGALGDEQRSATGIAKQKWENFEMPKMRGDMETYSQLTPLQRDLKKKEIGMMSGAYGSPGFAEKLFGITSGVAVPPVAEIVKPSGEKPIPWYMQRKQDRPFRRATPNIWDIGAY